MISKLETIDTPKTSQLDLSLVQMNGGYDPKWPWSKKISFVLSEIARCSTSREILEHLKIYDPTLESKEADSKALSSISATVTGKVKLGSLDRYSDYEGGEFYIGLKPWFRSKGVPDYAFKHK